MPDGTYTSSGDILSSVFGFSSFRPGQEEIVDAVVRGQNVLAIMPTGGGKSLCYQLPALCSSGVTVVISPLIALMRDQVRALRELGVSAGALTSGNSEDETEDVFASLDRGELKLLYMAPERLASSGTLSMLKRVGVSLIAVDEAHCVSQWGHDFRPDYLRIGALREALSVPVAAFTATADAETRDEIVSRLFPDAAPQIFLRGFDRPNLTLSFAPKNGPRRQILEFADARRGQSGIVYCATRAKTESLSQALTKEGHDACHYHGGMEPDDRRFVETRFQRDDGLIVVATIAFGMGVDKPDIRWVAHADLPKSIEAYYQEIGRAGRDGAPAETLTLYGADDIRLRRTQIDEGLAPEERRMADHGRLNALLGLAEAHHCRRQSLLGYFGEEAAQCGNCDLCASPPEIIDGTEAVRKALSAILRTGEWFGAGHLIDVLTGKSTEKVRQRGHDTIPTFGVGKEYSAAQWNGIFRQMLGLDLIRPDPARHGALRMTEAARPVLKADVSVNIRKDFAETRRSASKAKALVSDEDAPLLSALKARRRSLAEAANAPAYVIFNDRTLIEMAEMKPGNLDEFARISGVGAKKLERYGALFLEVIAGESPAAVHPKRLAVSGRSEGPVMDRLQAAQVSILRGESGLDRPLSCSTSELAKIAKGRPETEEDLARVIGERRAERFFEPFVAVLRSL